MINRSIGIVILATALAAPQVAFGALGTTWVNFGGQAVTFYPDPNNANTPPTTFNAMSLEDGASNSLFGTLIDATDLAAVQTAIVAALNTDYAGTGMTFVLANPGGTFNTLVIGNPNGGDGTNLYGQASIIDFRNKSLADTVGVSVTAHSNHAAPGGGWTVASVAQAIANTASHELGHAVALVHSDVVSMYTDTAGNVAAKQAAVQANEQMVKTPNNANFFADLSFGRYSQTKLDVSSNGVNVEVENGTASFITAAAADPARAGEAGGTIGTGRPLVVDSKNRVTVLGAFTAADTDVYTFTAPVGTLLTAEAFSITIAQRTGNTIDGFTIDILDDLGNVLTTVGSGASNVNGGEFDGLGALDTESRSLLFEYALPGDTTDFYGIRLNGAGADTTGNYELFVIIPEPASLVLLMLASAFTASRRCKVA